MNREHKPWLLLTMVDLKVVDAQAFEDGHALLQDVQRLAQLRVCCAVHSADLRGKNIRSDTGVGPLGPTENRLGAVPGCCRCGGEPAASCTRWWSRCRRR